MEVCTCNFGAYAVMLDDPGIDWNPHKPTCPFGGETE